MLPAEFEPAIPESERPQTHALYRAATRIGVFPHGPYSQTSSAYFFTTSKQAMGKAVGTSILTHSLP